MWWTKVDGRQNHLRDVAGPGRLTKIHYCTSMTGRHGWRQLLPRSNSQDGETPPSQAMLRHWPSTRGRGPIRCLPSGIDYPVASKSTAHEYLSCWCLLCSANVPVGYLDIEVGSRWASTVQALTAEAGGSQSSLPLLWRSTLLLTSEAGLAHFSAPLRQRLGSASCGASGLVVVEGATRACRLRMSI